MHGQATGLSIQSAQLEKDVKWIDAWVEALANGAEVAFGYDALRRKIVSRSEGYSAAQVEAGQKAAAGAQS